MRNYRNAFIGTLAAAIVLAGGLVFVVWRYTAPHGKSSAPKQPHPAPSTATAHSGDNGATGSSTAPEQTPLAPVNLTPQRFQSIGVKTAVAKRHPLFDSIAATGNVAVDERRVATVQTRFSGWIQKVYADAAYQHVRKGQPLFTIYSPQLVTTEQEFLLAQKNHALLASSTVPGVADGANALLTAAAERLSQWEIPQREINRLKSSGRIEHELEIDSPVTGYITERNALPNMYVQPGAELYKVADLSTVWVFAQVFQSDFGQIKTGDPAEVTTDAYPGRTFRGRVDFIYPEIDVSTRTAKVRLVFSNRGLTLTPGMFVNVNLKIPIGNRLAVPASAVFQTGTRSVVFVDHGGGYLEPRDIKLGPRAGDEFVILSGLKAGERIVTSANFLIDSESQLQAALGSFAPPPPGAGAAASMNQSNAPAAKVEFSTSPSPPAKGSDTVRVKLTSSNGSPVEGADVTVSFYMPAMPAMGMAAMRSTATLSSKSGGVYEGRLTLGSGGTWQVTILARQNGAVIARQQLSVTVEGGM